MCQLRLTPKVWVFNLSLPHCKSAPDSSVPTWNYTILWINEVWKIHAVEQSWQGSQHLMRKCWWWWEMTVLIHFWSTGQQSSSETCEHNFKIKFRRPRHVWLLQSCPSDTDTLSILLFKISHAWSSPQTRIDVNLLGSQRVTAKQWLGSAVCDVAAGLLAAPAGECTLKPHPTVCVCFPCVVRGWR